MVALFIALSLLIILISLLLSSRRPPRMELLDQSPAGVAAALASHRVERQLAAIPIAGQEHLDLLRSLFERSRDDDRVTSEIVWALRRLYEPLPVDLRDLISRTGVATKIAIARHIADDPFHDHQSTLLELLADASLEVQIGAAQSLAMVGTIEAVPALQEWSKGMFRPERVREAGAEAIRAVQSRARGGEHGQLSLARGEKDRGAVSLSEGTGGGLSIDAKD